ncbi:tetratricopeptide repeat protein [Parabacteroides sp. PF5-9]|uniref:tetratricopeptide repeat protein n=1 Tax=Parabacteroides sp. PF5-9 TaxID=1742404 RepID=UPI00247373E0|nr:tetratricopeptide repeat protein [Parabacteroides sp. PF5-9]
MRKFFLFFVFIVSVTAAFAQEERVEELINRGIAYHDAKEYDKAIELYREALRLDPYSAEAMYELSLSLLEIQDYVAAIEYCDKLIDRDDKYAILSYNTKGSCLNYQGRTSEAIDVFLKGIKKEDSFYLLYFNLGLAYYANENYQQAKDAFVNALDLNPQHAGSHLNLGRTMWSLDRRIESLLSLYYFLLIEPNTDRSEWAYHALQEQFLKNGLSKSQFGAADVLYSTYLSAEGSDNESEMDLFIRNTDAFFSVLNEINLRKNPRGENVWWSFYTDFFKELSSLKYTEVFCHYISLSVSDLEEEWLKRNNDQVRGFAIWLRQQ